MATAAHNAPPLRSSRRPATAGAETAPPRRSPAAPGQARRRGPNLPRELAYLAPILRERGRIEALAAALIDLLDSFDAPTADMEDEQDCCSAADDDMDALRLRGRHADSGAGDPEDAEPDNDDACLATDDLGTFHRQVGLQRGGTV